MSGGKEKIRRKGGMKNRGVYRRERGRKTVKRENNVRNRGRRRT